MNVQPPGYNPGESMLQGGNANITPVMGGGGNGFIEGNPNDSMLSGGNSVDIVPLKGGKRKTRSKRKTGSKRKQRGGEYKNTMKRIVDIQHETLQALNPTEPSPLLKILGQTVNTIPEPGPESEPHTDNADAPRPQVDERTSSEIALEAEKKVLEQPPPVIINTQPVVAEQAPQKVTLSEAALKVQKDVLKGFENQEPDDVMSFNLSDNQIGGQTSSNIALQAQKQALEEDLPPIEQHDVETEEPDVEPPPEVSVDLPLKYMSSSEAALMAQKDALKQLKANQAGGGTRILTEKTITLDAAPATVDMKYKLPALIKQYKTHIKSKPWHRTDLVNAAWKEVALSKNDRCSVSKSKLSDTKGVNDSDRIARYLNITTKNIIVFEPVNGNVDVFLKCKKYADESALKNKTIIFSPPFFNYGRKDLPNLFAHFLDFKMQAPDNIYILTEHTPANKLAGCLLTEGTNEALLNMFEPSYIILPTMCKIDDKEYSGVVFSAAATGETPVPDVKSKRYASMSSFLAMEDRSDLLVFPCDTAKRDERLSTLFNIKTYIGNKPSTKLYTFDTDDTPEMLNYTMFQPSTDAITDGVMLKEISGKLIRKPISLEVQSDPVKKDWLAGKFIQDEADYLNSLNIRPDMLRSIFGDGWLTDLANFLDNMVGSDCFSDIAITTQAKCGTSANFVEKIFEYFMLHDDRIAALEEEEGMFAKQAAANMVKKAAGEAAFAAKGLDEENDKLKAELKTLEEREAIMKTGSITTDALLKNPFKDGILLNHRRVSGLNDDWNREVVRNVSDIMAGNFKWLRTVLLIRSGDDEVSLADLYVDAIDDIEANDKVRRKIIELNSTYPAWSFQ
jgi:hypothetical protein